MLKRIAALLLLALLPVLAACGNVAGANTPAPPPELPPAPPLSAEAAARLAEPTAEVPDAPVPAAPQGATLFSAGFDRDLTGWTAEDFSPGPAGPATWKVENGSAAQAGNDLGLPDPGGTYLLSGDTTWSDYSLSAQAFARTPTQLGLVARKNAQGYYQARLEAGSEASTLILEYVDEQGATRELARGDAPAAVGRWLTLHMQVQGDTISAQVDDGAMVSAQDASSSSGQIGLYAVADGVARFDNVVVAP